MLYPYTRIKNEEIRQLEKWGVQIHSPQEWLAILVEEVGEVAKAILEEDWKGYEDELTQVAATAVTILSTLHAEKLEKEYK